MTRKRYEHYVDSGEAWLGSYPGHWHKKPLWTLFSRVKRQGFEGEELLSVYRDHGVIPKSSREDNFNKPSDDLGAYQLVDVGDLAVNKMKAWQGSVAISEYRGIVSPAYHVYAPLHSEHPRFFHYLMRCDRYITGYLSVSKGIRVNQWDLQPEYHSRMPILVPLFEEQMAIATFLDHETAKIDALIAEQQRLIELLQEKRQAVISHAVTKGLNPAVPMKDSGVEWLGEVPEHWEVSPIKHLCDIYSGFPFKSDLFQAGGIPIVRMSNISGGSIDLQDAVCVSEHEVPAEALIKTGDLLLGLSGSVGNFGIATERDLPAAVNQRVALIRTSNPILKHFFGSSLFSDQVTCGLPSTTIANVSASQLGNCLLAVPPSDEQEQIEAFLLGFVSSSMELMTSIESSLSLLQERRSALISAAVTGQIDVRGLTHEAESA